MLINWEYKKKLLVLSSLCFFLILLIGCPQPEHVNKPIAARPSVTLSPPIATTQSSEPSIAPPTPMCSTAPPVYEYYTVNTDSTNFKKINNIDNNLENGYQFISNMSYLPDGKNFIFSINDRIIKLNSETGEKNVLIYNAFGNILSPDRTKILYEKYQSNTKQIFVTDIDGSNPKIINSAPENGYSFIKWSPDSSKILYSQNMYDSERKIIFKLFVKDINGNELYNTLINGIFYDDYLSWSPDSKKIAYLDEGTYPLNMSIIDLQSTTLSKIIDDSIPKSILSWSSDGQKLFYISKPDNIKNELYYFDTIKKNKTKVTDITSYNVSLSNDYKYLIYSLTEDNLNNIYLLNTSDLSVKKLTSFNLKEALFGAVWSDDNKKIAITISTNYMGEKYKDQQNTDLYLINNDGTNKLRLTNSPVSEQKQKWSPDNKLLFFTSNISLNKNCQRDLVENWNYAKQ